MNTHDHTQAIANIRESAEYLTKVYLDAHEELVLRRFAQMLKNSARKEA